MATTIEFHVDDEQLKKADKTIKDLKKELRDLQQQDVQQRQQFLQGSESYKQEVKALKDTTVMMLNETKTATKDMVVESKKYWDIFIESVSLGLSVGRYLGPKAGIATFIGSGIYGLAAKSREDKPDTVPFSNLELMKSGTMANFLEKQERVKHLAEFSKKRIDSEEEVSKGILAILQKQKDQILKDLDKLDVKGDMKQILTLKEKIEAINIQADAEGIMLRGIKAFREKQAKEAVKPTTLSSHKPADVRTLPTAEVHPLAVKTASEVATKLYTQMRDTKLVTAEITKELTQVNQQGGKSFLELINLSGRLKDTLVRGFDQVGQGIEQSVHNRLVQAFRGAHSVAQQFFVSVLDQLTAIATKAASGAIIGGLLSFIPGVGTFSQIFKSITGFAGGGIIPEPVLGVGLRSGTGYTFGERGPEYVMPNNQLQSARFSNNGSNQLAQRIAGLEKAIAGGTWRISGRDIVYSYDRNSYGVNQRRF